MLKQILFYRYLVPLISCVVLFLFVIHPSTVMAHSAIEKTVPQNLQVLDIPPTEIDIWFEEPVDVYSNSIRVTMDGKEVQKGKPVVDHQDGRHITAYLQENLTPGTYEVYIHALAVDGHEVKETFSFIWQKSVQKTDNKLEKSLPEDGSMISNSTERMELWFTKPSNIDIIGLFDKQGNAVKLGEPYKDPQNDRHIMINIKQSLTPGTYAVRWITANDGPDGIFYFAVNQFSSLDLTGKRIYHILPSQIGLNTIAHWLAFAGLLSLLGGTWFFQFITKQIKPSRYWSRTVWILYGLSTLGLILELIAYRMTLSDASWKELVSFRSGWVPLLQLLFLITSLSFKRALHIFKLGFLTVTILLFALTGHSISPEYGGTYGILLVAVHICAAAVWFGGLLALLFIPKDVPQEQLKEAGRKFSWWALISIAAITISGVWMLSRYVPSFNWISLINSEWGRALVFKTILIVGIAFLAYWQRRALTKAKQEWLLPFLIRMRVEVGLGLIVLFFAAVLIDMSPKAAERGISPLEIERGDVKASLHISPLRAGSNVITVNFTNVPSYSKVRMKFFMPPDIRYDYTAFSLGNGVYSVVGNQLHAPGTMYIEVDGTRANGEEESFPFKVQIPGEILK